MLGRAAERQNILVGTVFLGVAYHGTAFAVHLPFDQLAFLPEKVSGKERQSVHLALQGKF